jgi:HAE1 family hydrophobic/amphiphilic exporter-1
MGALKGSPIYSPVTQTLVALETMSDVSFQTAPHTIRRQDGVTSIDVSVDFDKETENKAGVVIVGSALKDMVFPRGYTWDASKVFERQGEDQGAQLSLILMSVIFVFLLMGVLFESWLLPISVITTVPMAVMGAFWLLWLAETSFDTMAGIGLVVLVGVVVNNGIVLIDLIHQLRSEGMARTEAILLAGQHRFRPILMTALTTIFGLLPMALGNGEFVGLSYAPLGQTVIGGLIAATALTLIFVPFLYAWLDDVRNAFSQVFRFAIGVK